MDIHCNKYLKVTEEKLIKNTFSSGVHSVLIRCGGFMHIISFYPHNNLVGWIAIVSFYNQKEIMFSKLQKPVLNYPEKRDVPVAVGKDMKIL